jgi:hypothetical protein
MLVKKRRDVFQVVSDRGSECLFTNNKIVSDPRKAAIINQALANNSYFSCHQSTLLGVDLCCRGFFDLHQDDSLVTHLAVELNLVEFVKLPD